MLLFESLSIAWTGMSGNKARSILTMLGVIIGVAAVITLVGVGQGASSSISAQIEGMGSNLLVITPLGRNAKLTAEDAGDLLDRVSTISAAVPSLSQYATLKWGTDTLSVSVEGTTAEYPDVRDFRPMAGRYITEQDVEERRRVAVVGYAVVEDLFGGKNPIGQSLSVDGQAYTVVGVMESKGAVLGQNLDSVVFIPISTAQRLFGTTRLTRLYARANSAAEAPLAVSHITAIYENKFRRSSTVSVTSQDQLLESVGSMASTMSLMLGAIAGISLLVGGIGIMNIMLVSVSERTREIGIRKAVGAGRSHILWQFLVESILLSISGGLLGIAAGIGGTRLVNDKLGYPAVVSPAAIVISFAFCALLGIGFGLYPAIKAANMVPVEALQYE